MAMNVKRGADPFKKYWWLILVGFGLVGLWVCAPVMDTSTGGRRPGLVRLNPDFGYFVGVDLGSPHVVEDTFVVCVLMDINGKVISRVKIEKEVEPQDKFIQRIEKAVEDVIAGSKIPREKVLSIGLSM